MSQPPSPQRPTDPPKPAGPTPTGTWVRLLLIVAAVMAVNALLVARLDPAVSRITIPYSPTFLAQVKAVDDLVKSFAPLDIR